ncbi:hypothetical protein [Ligilactobacillus equi]|uniref:Uncharacterized protein n=1 Tax=Ligilactobacillus equi DSM 15833 = JCM 10991 TaxID=1423740 RepID=A0A0R1U0A1_9LACO|nr:hypothetical protein [Ligilactobacillus equi]KRL84306.1 hypothetical protein FC36_GL000229 [Ligilactobacillus equi DSM 15833 = JCM 10991]
MANYTLHTIDANYDELVAIGLIHKDTVNRGYGIQEEEMVLDFKKFDPDYDEKPICWPVYRDDNNHVMWFKKWIEDNTVAYLISQKFSDKIFTYTAIYEGELYTKINIKNGKLYTVKIDYNSDEFQHKREHIIETKGIADELYLNDEELLKDPNVVYVDDNIVRYRDGKEISTKESEVFRILAHRYHIVSDLLFDTWANETYPIEFKGFRRDNDTEKWYILLESWQNRKEKKLSLDLDFVELEKAFIGFRDELLNIPGIKEQVSLAQAKFKENL